MKKILTWLSIILLSAGISKSQVTQQWVQRFTSDSTRDESVNDMFVDSQGNVYVTGYQKSLPFPYHASIEAVTIKYNSLGELQWIQNYHASENNGAFGRAVHVDATGNVYVTGESAIYSGGANKALVIKYSPSGTQLWSYLFAYSSAYNGGFDIITDADGNVYVTGEYATNVITYNNIFLVKFSPSGNLINQTFYNSGSEGARKIGMDGSGKIIIGGYLNEDDSTAFIALKYEQNLDFVWASRWGNGIGNVNKIDMQIDINSNVILLGTNSITIDYSLVKFNPAGFVQWGKNYSSAGGNDIASAVDCDNSGNVYVTGTTGSAGFPLTQKITSIKYLPDGSQSWIQSFDGGTVPDGYSGYDIDVDDSTNIYITGVKHSTSDIVTLKYNQSGNLSWSIIYNGTGNSIDMGVSAASDGNGNVYTSGNSLGISSGNDIAVIKYSSTSIGIQNISNEIPDKIHLYQNYPNPFNPVTNIRYSITKNSSVNLKVFDINGRFVSELVNENQHAGTYEVTFDGSTLSSGNYFYRLRTDGFVETKKFTLIK